MIKLQTITTPAPTTVPAQPRPIKEPIKPTSPQPTTPRNPAPDPSQKPCGDPGTSPCEATKKSLAQAI